MTVQSHTLSGSAPNWYCQRCELKFADPSDNEPCPRCKSDDQLLPIGQPAAPAQTKAAPKMRSPVRTGERRRIERVPVWLFGTAIFGWWWISGGRYTIDGIPLLFNLLASFLYIPLRLAPVTNPLWYLLLAWLPFMVSIIERRYAPWRQSTIDGTMIVIAVVWVIVSGFDGFSTYLAITNPPPDALIISHQIARSTPGSAVWSVATTFLPEIALGLLWRWLRG